jgi:pyruvate formate lyase activating enzyme
MTQNNERGAVFDIQRYSIHDGPGIRTTVFLKGCPLRCYWCQNPESQSAKPEILFDASKCTGCGACVAACAAGASRLSEGKSVIDREACRGCGKCVEVCLNEARRLVGKEMTVEEVMQPVLKDVRFYENSGGGVTLSGGEPTAQPDFASALLRRCKELGLHTVMETCGYAPWPVFERLLQHTDLVFYDLKHMDPGKHFAGTQVKNLTILENAKRIHSLKPMIVRVPLIPGFNDSPAEIEATVRFVKTELPSTPVELLPYNKLGEGKYGRLDRSCRPLETMGEDHVAALNEVVQRTLAAEKSPPRPGKTSIHRSKIGKEKGKDEDSRNRGQSEKGRQHGRPRRSRPGGG